MKRHPRKQEGGIWISFLFLFFLEFSFCGENLQIFTKFHCTICSVLFRFVLFSFSFSICRICFALYKIYLYSFIVLLVCCLKFPLAETETWVLRPMPKLDKTKNSRKTRGNKKKRKDFQTNEKKFTSESFPFILSWPLSFSTPWTIVFFCPFSFFSSFIFGLFGNENRITTSNNNNQKEHRQSLAHKREI